MDYARTLMMEKNLALKYKKEVTSIVVYTLNRVQIKNGTNLTPYELWFGYTPSVKYFKIFGSKCYILKDDRQGNWMLKERKVFYLDTPREEKLKIF